MKKDMDHDTTRQKKHWALPWWLYLAFAIMSYLFLNYLVPSLPTSDPTLANILRLAEKAAPIVSIAFLLLTANALYRDDPPPQNKTDAGPDQKEQPPSQ